MTVQEALEKLGNRREGEPRVVHDHGSQFISHEWRSFVKGAGITDIKTRIAERKEKLVQAVEMRQVYWQRKDAREQGQTLT